MYTNTALFESLSLLLSIFELHLERVSGNHTELLLANRVSMLLIKIFSLLY